MRRALHAPYETHQLLMSWHEYVGAVEHLFQKSTCDCSDTEPHVKTPSTVPVPRVCEMNSHVSPESPGPV
jgi:hypothetical protein